MDDTLLMSRFKSFSDLLGYWQCFIDWDSSVCNAISQSRPFHQLQDQRLYAIGLLDAVDLCDVRMVQAGENLRFTLEPGEPVRVFGATCRFNLVSVAW